MASLKAEAAAGKLHAKYVELYTALAVELDGMTSPLVREAKADGSCALGRDWFEQQIEEQVRAQSLEKKFQFAAESCQLEGQRAFPYEPKLLEDEVAAQATLAPLFKLQHPSLQFSEIASKYELVIRQQHPFLQMLVNKIGAFEEINHFYRVLAFINELGRAVNNRITRRQANERTLKDYLSQLAAELQDDFPEVLNHPDAFVASWSTLARTQGALQVGCKFYGTMNDELTEDSPVNAFLLDALHKENYHGRVVTALFHNFAMRHNELLASITTAKNLVPCFRHIVFEPSAKGHPQRISRENVLDLDGAAVAKVVNDNCINSIVYGEIVLLNNFEAAERHFLQQLLSHKVEFETEIEKFKSVCFNGEAFEQLAENSSALGDVKRNHGQTEFDELIKQQLQEHFAALSARPSYNELLLRLRGAIEILLIEYKDPERELLAKGTLRAAAEDSSVSTVVEFMSEPLGDVPAANMVACYEFIEQLLKPHILASLPDTYQKPISAADQAVLREYISTLNRSPDTLPSSSLFEGAMFKFAARNLLSGAFNPDAIILHFILAKEDFWPEGTMDKVDNLASGP